MGMNFKKIRSFDLLAILLVIGAIILGINIFTNKSDFWVTVYIKLNNQPSWVDEAIKVGDSESLGKEEIAKILDKKSIPAEALTELEVQWLEWYKPGWNPRPIFNLTKNNRDITLKVKLSAKKDPLGELEFKGNSLKVNEPIEIKTRTIHIRGVVMAMEGQ